MDENEPHVGDTFPSDWKYISEGGATIVFSYIGPSHPHFDGMVLRLRKVGLEHVRTEGDGNDDETEEEEPDDPQIEFQHRIMARLIPPEHLPKLLTVHVVKPWLQSLSLLHDVERPVRRREVDQIDIRKRKAVLATDLLGGKGGLGVEIKPKWSFLPNLSHLSDKTRPIKSQTCRFCMHTHLRHTEGDKLSVSVTYCPLDLFSGNPKRVEHALRSLWDTWNSTGGAVNNLKIFANGKAVSPGDKHRLLEPPTPAELPVPPDDEIKEELVAALLTPLVEAPVLQILGGLQRHLDALDVEGLKALWVSAGKDKKLGQDEPQPTLDEWSELVDRFQAHKSQHDRPKAEDLRYHMLSYLLSATFKDCSIIIRIPGGIVTGVPPQSNGAATKGSAATAPAKSTVSVIDLDPKGIDRLAKWEKLDAQIIETYGKLDEVQRKQCVDALGRQ